MISIYIDTNVFLDFYQSPTDRMQIFKDIRDRVDCIVVPEQTKKEFARNRAARLIQLAKKVLMSAKVNIYTTAIVRDVPNFAKWVEAQDAFKSNAEIIAKQLQTWAGDESSDPVYQEFVKLTLNGTTMSTSDAAIAKAQVRKLLGEPPTSPDKHTIGDEVIWETLLENCQNDLIIVSRDSTFLDNESLLRQEFENGERRLLLVTKKLGEALKRVGKPSTAIEDAEWDEGFEKRVAEIASQEATLEQFVQENAVSDASRKLQWIRNMIPERRDVEILAGRNAGNVQLHLAELFELGREITVPFEFYIDLDLSVDCTADAQSIAKLPTWVQTVDDEPSRPLDNNAGKPVFVNARGTHRCIIQGLLRIRFSPSVLVRELRIEETEVVLDLGPEDRERQWTIFMTGAPPKSPEGGTENG